RRGERIAVGEDRRVACRARSDAEQFVELDLQEEVAHQENDEHDGEQDGHSGEYELETRMAHLLDEGSPGVDPDPRKKQGKAEVAKHAVSRRRHVPNDRPGASEPAEHERGDERTSGQAESNRPDAGDRNGNEADERSERDSQSEGNEAEARL